MAVTQLQNGNSCRPEPRCRRPYPRFFVGLLVALGACLALAGMVKAQPVITTQPANEGACAGSTTTFSVTATGNGLTYQWQLSTDGGHTFAPIGGATGGSYTPPTAQVSDNGKYYDVIITDASNSSVTSAAAELSVFSGVPTASAGPHQVITNGGVIQLAGSVGNATGGTWSGGSGTFNPNANTLNARYTPSAAEIAAGSWALTLTASTPCGTASNTMSFSIAPPALRLPVITSSSSAGVNVCLDPNYAGTDLGTKCSSSVNNLEGYVVVQLDTNGAPSEISLEK